MNANDGAKVATLHLLIGDTGVLSVADAEVEVEANVASSGQTYASGEDNFAISTITGNFEQTSGQH